MVEPTPGQIVDSRALSTAAGVNCGVLIVEGSTHGEDGALSTDAASVGFPVGFSVFQIAKEPTVPNYQEFDMVPCLRRGRIWLPCSGTISDGEHALFIVHATGLPSETDDASTTPPPAGQFIRCLKGNTTGLLGLFEISLC